MSLKEALEYEMMSFVEIYFTFFSNCALADDQQTTGDYRWWYRGIVIEYPWRKSPDRKKYWRSPRTDLSVKEHDILRKEMKIWGSYCRLGFAENVFWGIYDVSMNSHEVIEIWERRGLKISESDLQGSEKRH